MHFGVLDVDYFEYLFGHFFRVATAIDVLIHQAELFCVHLSIRRVFVYGSVITARGYIGSIIAGRNGADLYTKGFYLHTQGFGHQQ